MQSKFLLIVLIITQFIGCNKNDNKVEILKTHEFEYLTENETDTPIKFKDDENHEKLNKALLEIGNSLKNEYKDFPDKIDFHFRVYFSEIGQVNYIKNLKRPAKQNKLLVDEFLSQIGNLLSRKTIVPAVKDGFNVKFRTDVKIGLENYFDSLRLFIPDFLKNMPSFNSSIENKKDYLAEVDVMPSPIGGLYAIQEKIKYPEIAKRAGIEGRVFVNTFIDENGDVIGTEVMRGIGAGCDEMAVYAVENTKFNPGRVNGKAVKVQVTIPIMFKLN